MLNFGTITFFVLNSISFSNTLPFLSFATAFNTKSVECASGGIKNSFSKDVVCPEVEKDVVNLSDTNSKDIIEGSSVVASATIKGLGASYMSWTVFSFNTRSKEFEGSSPFRRMGLFFFR